MSNFTRFRKTAVAAINNITLTELFARMWSNSDDETLAKLAGNYEIISEKRDDENFNISIHDYLYDAGHSYLVIKVSGKDNYEIADDMLVYAYNIEVSENDSCPYTYETYVLKKKMHVLFLREKKELISILLLKMRNARHNIYQVRLIRMM